MEKPIRYSLLVIGVLVVSLVINTTSVHAEVRAKFSPGGTRVTISAHPSETLAGIDIVYCDGTSSHFHPVPYRGICGGFTYLDSKPMSRITVYTTGRGHEADGIAGNLTSFVRECDNPIPSDLNCKLIQLNPSFHRTTREPIVFKSLATVTNVYLRMPGYDDIIISERPAWNSGQRLELALHYNSSTGYWEGEFASMFLPVGEHKDVVLIVRDEFGQQGKCRVGDLTVMP